MLVVPAVYLLLDPISEWLRRNVIDPEAARVSEDVPVEEEPARHERDRLGVN